jgi:hypothetical protein
MQISSGVGTWNHVSSVLTWVEELLEMDSMILSSADVEIPFLFCLLRTSSWLDP